MNEWKASERAQQGPRMKFMFKGYRYAQRGLVWKRHEGVNIDHRRCCEFNHVKASVAVECAKRTARRLNKEEA